MQFNICLYMESCVFVRVFSFTKVHIKVYFVTPFLVQISLNYYDSYRNMIGICISIHCFLPGTSEVYISRWFTYEAFQFLSDRDEPRKRMNTVSKNKNHICIIDIIVWEKKFYIHGFDWLHISKNHKHHSYFK